MKKLDNKGFTLVELMATLILIGVVMAITIPNVTGIFNQGKTTTYAEDAKKLRTSAEYMLRGNSAITKPTANGDCIAISLAYLDNEEFKAPYGGTYLDTRSFVIIKKKNTSSEKKYYYYVQLIESLPDGGYRGFKLLNATLLDGDGYFDRVGEYTSINTFADLNNYITNPNSLKNNSNLSGVGCTTVLKVYTPEVTS